MKKSLQVVLIYALMFAAVTMVEFLSIGNTPTGEQQLGLSFDLMIFVKKLPNLLTSYAAIICYTMATVMGCVAKFKETDEKYIDFDKKICTWTTTSYRPTLFNKYGMVINRKRKAVAWRNSINRKWIKLEKKQTNKDLIAWTEYKAKVEEWNEKIKTDTSIPHPVTTNKYCNKREKYELLFSDKYVDENIDKLNVKFDAITASLVIGGTVNSTTEVNGNEYVTKHKSFMIVLEKLPSLLTNMALVFFATSLIVDNIDLSIGWAAWLLFTMKLVVKIFSMLNAAYGSVKYSVGYNERVTLKDIRFRWGVICEHDQWAAQQARKEANDGNN